MNLKDFKETKSGFPKRALDAARSGNITMAENEITGYLAALYDLDVVTEEEYEEMLDEFYEKYPQDEDDKWKEEFMRDRCREQAMKINEQREEIEALKKEIHIYQKEGISVPELTGEIKAYRQIIREVLGKCV